MVLLRRLPVDRVRVVAEGWQRLERRVKSWLWSLELLRLLNRPASVPHKFGFIFCFHSLKSFLFFLDTDWFCDRRLSHESGRIVFEGLLEVQDLGLFLIPGLY